MREPIRSYALVKAERMYDACKSCDELEIIDRYALLAEPNRFLYGVRGAHPNASARANCLARLGIVAFWVGK